MSGDYAGRLRERVALLRAGAARDALGAGDGAWEAIALVWAGVEPEGRGPLFSGEARSAQPLWRVTMRPCAVAVGDRIERVDGVLAVREVRRDPRQPDRVVAIGEELR